MKVKISTAISMITGYIKAGLVPLIKGSPGLGKSQIVHQIAKEYNLMVIDLRLAQCDPCDLSGFPTVEGGKADYMPMKHFPIEGDPLPTYLDDQGVEFTYSGWLLFLDELTSAPPAIQAASYKLILDRMVGSHHLHKKVAIVGAGNLETDNAIVEPMSTALQSRLAHIELVLDTKEWLDWAMTNDIDHRITSYIQFKPGQLYTFSPDHTDNTYACPRTWEFSNRVLKVTEEGSVDRLPMLAGVISEGVAREFIGFMKIHDELPKLSSILADPTGIKVPHEPSILYAMTGNLSHNASQDNLNQMMKYINRLPKEFQVVCLRETLRRNKTLIGHPDMRKWVTASAHELF